MADRSPRVVVYANFFAAELRDFLSFYFVEAGISAELKIESCDSTFERLLDPGLGFLDADLAIVLVAFDTMAIEPFHPSEGNPSQHFELLVDNLRTAIDHRSALTTLLVCCPLLNPSIASRLLYEKRIARRLEGLTVDIMSSKELSQSSGVRLPDLLADSNASALDGVFSELGYSVLGMIVARYSYRHLGHPSKVIVVDCDDTLWFGSCGELGAGGIRIGHGHLAFQKLLARQAEAGQLICLCSKNNEPDVLAVFETNPSMALSTRAIAFHRINWNSKPENLRSLSRELNLSLDSFLFIDNDPIECSAVRTCCPEVRVVLFPTNQAEIVQLLPRIWDLHCLAISKEDLQRAQQYKDNVKREITKHSAITIEHFIASLELEVTFLPLQAADLKRVAQLMQRVNQFNLNGIHWSGELHEWCRHFECFTIRARDKFGDYGIIGAIAYAHRSSRLVVESLLMSCRALGKGIEGQIAKHITIRARDDQIHEVVFRYRDTQRNAPIRTFLNQYGVDIVEDCTIVSADKLSLSRLTDNAS